MTRALLVTTVLMCAAGCRTPPERPAPEPSPPDGRQTRVSDDGTKHTEFTPLGLIGFGETREGALPDHVIFPGYELYGQAGVTASVEAIFDGCSVGLVALYGAQDDHGLWDAARVHDTGSGRFDLEYALPETGMYFVLMRCLEGERVTFTLRLECEGCADPSPCEQIAACDLFCEQGFERDDFDCRACACVEPASCEDVRCDDGQRCEDGVCRDDPRSCTDQCGREVEPVCGDDGVTRPNACHADCAEVGHSPGACPTDECGPEAPCPGRQPCVRGHCCDCPREARPVCGMDDHEHLNACTLECSGVELRHEGPCVERPCDEDRPCREGWECRPARRPGNDEACRDRDDPGCVRECVPPPRIQPCTADSRACEDPRATCYLPPGARRGACLFACVPERPQCPQGAACAVVDGLEDARGVCLLACDPAEPMCAGELRCLADARGTNVCQPCSCPRDVPPEPVCVGDRSFRSPCDARCAGHDEWRAGACNPDACVERCADVADTPVCVGHETLRNPCEARCLGHGRWMDGPCEPPCPEGDPACEEGACLERCVGEMLNLVCGDGTIYASVCEARCAHVEPERLPGACLEGVATGCRVAEDCAPTGCEASVCASAPTRACPDYSPAAACFTLGACGCLDGRCQWRPDERTRACLQAMQPNRPGEGDGDGRQ